MDQESQLQLGATVHLKSGSPDLKIVNLIEKAVEVEWFDEDRKSHQSIFPSTSLSPKSSAECDELGKYCTTQSAGPTTL